MDSCQQVEFIHHQWAGFPCPLPLGRSLLRYFSDHHKPISLAIHSPSRIQTKYKTRSEALFVGTALLGIGMASIFATGFLWVERRLKASSFKTKKMIFNIPIEGDRPDRSCVHGGQLKWGRCLPPSCWSTCRGPSHGVRLTIILVWFPNPITPGRLVGNPTRLSLLDKKTITQICLRFIYLTTGIWAGCVLIFATVSF